MKVSVANRYKLVFALSVSVIGCGSEVDHGGRCDAFTGFSTPIVPIASVSRVIPLGELNPPEDVVPAVSGGFGFNVPMVDVVSPGDVVVTAITSTEYVVSPGRQGVTDYSLTMYACDDIKIDLAHVVTLAPSLASELGDGACETNAGAEETTKDCRYTLERPLTAGDPIGTAGMYQNGQLAGLDFSAVDLTYQIPWLNPKRIGDIERYHHGMCAYVNFAPEIANAYLDKATSGLTPLNRTDRCGVAAIDVANTPQGIWVRKDNPVTLAADLLKDAPNFLTLSPGVADPEAELLVSSGVSALGTDLVTISRKTTGRINVDFSVVPNDGSLHCYDGHTPQGDARAYLIALDASNTLTVEPTTYPCTASSPDTWAFSGNALAFIR